MVGFGTELAGKAAAGSKIRSLLFSGAGAGPA